MQNNRRIKLESVNTLNVFSYRKQKYHYYHIFDDYNNNNNEKHTHTNTHIDILKCKYYSIFVFSNQESVPVKLVTTSFRLC
jgi:hypothetical protein